ncbi:MAG TPA: gamma-glutamylcyclotransferase family protein [Alphaproteobacteria bacterium]|nr:gamma-glutamylcyclotransferase family protein [Alphaproteobacteria bacterium]
MKSKMQKKNLKYYFAYGSNMSIGRLNYRMKTTTRNFPSPKGRADILCRGIISGWELRFNCFWDGDVYANIMKKDGCSTEGIIFEIDKAGLSRLDAFEDVPSHYLRKKINVRIGSSKKEIECFVYIANPQIIKEGLRPRKEYLSHLLEAKAYLSKNYFEKLSKTKTVD